MCARSHIHNLREAAALHDRALELNPNLAMAWALSAITCAYQGDTMERAARSNAIRRCRHSIRWRSFRFAVRGDPFVEA